MANNKTQNKDKIDKENFIEYLSSMTPGEINDLIATRGKPPKLINPIHFFKTGDK